MQMMWYFVFSKLPFKTFDSSPWQAETLIIFVLLRKILICPMVAYLTVVQQGLQKQCLYSA